ncbi:MAG: bZIP transcription factor [Methanomassiliicoccaceae archaeon]|nr:bZIP transcription factor [Methanomassiliicoccaceae archaeon]
MAVTLDELEERVSTLEKENAELKAAVSTLSKNAAQTVAQPRSLSPNGTAAAASITGDSVADVLGGFITNFNSKADTGKSPIGYMMSEVEVDLKTVVVTKADGQLALEPADVNTPAQAVTPLKLSVKAVPRATAVTRPTPTTR